MKHHIISPIIGTTTVIILFLLALSFIYISVSTFEHEISFAGHEVQLPANNKRHLMQMYTYSNLTFRYDERQKDKVEIKRFNVVPFERDDVISQKQLLSIAKCIDKNNCKQIDKTDWGKTISIFKDNAFQVGNITVVYGLTVDNSDNNIVHADIFIINDTSLVIIRDPVYLRTNQKYLDIFSKNLTPEQKQKTMEALQQEIVNRSSDFVKRDLAALSKVAHSIQLISQK